MYGDRIVELHLRQSTNVIWDEKFLEKVILTIQNLRFC